MKGGEVPEGIRKKKWRRFCASFDGGIEISTSERGVEFSSDGVGNNALIELLELLQNVSKLFSVLISTLCCNGKTFRKWNKVEHKIKNSHKL